jgi:hypothetical protein
MSNQNNRAGASDGSSNQPAEEGRRHKTGGHMGAGRSGAKSLGSEKQDERDNMGSKEPGDDLDRHGD